MATSKAFITNESEETISGVAGADHAWTLEGIADGAGRVSVQIDLGAAPRKSEFQLYLEVLFQATPTQGGTLDFYKAEAPDSDATMIPGDIGATDAALGDVDQLRSLDFIGSLTAEEADTTKMVMSPINFLCKSRYLTLVMDNNSGATTNATDTNCIGILVGRAQQGQAT